MKDCEHEQTHKTGHIYEEGYLVEYNERCENCGCVVGVWAYGNYYENEDGE